jgi:hypothetical protein
MTKPLRGIILPFLLIVFTAQANYTTPGTGATYSLQDLVANSAGDVTFLADAYLVNDTITISANDVLSITTDATLRFAVGTFLDINGTIIINPLQGVLFTAQNATAGFLGMRINASPASVLRKLTFEYAVSLRITDCSIPVDDCTIQFNNNNASTSFGNGAIVLTRSNALITNSRFLSNQRAAIQGGANINNAPTISNCLFMNNNTTNQNVPQINLGATGTDTAKILNNQLLRASTRSGGIGFLPLGETRTVISGNLIKNNRYGITLNGGSNINALISYNVIDSNNTEGNPLLGGSGISFSGGSATSHQNAIVTGNYIRWNLWGITIGPTSTGGGAMPNLGNLQNADTTDDGKNWIYGNTNASTPDIQLYNNNVDDIMAQNNYWGSNDPVAIEAGIFHRPDNSTLGLVNFTTYRTLPVRLIDFQATLAANKVTLIWRTSTENNSDHFSIEKSTDGQLFTPIARVAAAGYTATTRAYRFVDENISGRKQYYRLKLVDKDGRFKYSQVVLVHSGNEKQMAFTVHPTAFTGSQALNSQVTTTTDQIVTLEWITTNGRVLQRSTKNLIAGSNSFALNPDIALPQGIIYVRCTSAEINQTIALLKY